MKTFILLIILLKMTSTIGQEINPNYDSLLAKKLGANDKGMKTYILGLLKTGSNDVQDKKLKDALFKGHIDFVESSIIKGVMVVQGDSEKTKIRIEDFSF